MYFGTYNVAVTGDLRRHNVRLIGGFGVHVCLRAVLSSARGFLSHNLELPSLSKQVGSSRITLCSLQDKLCITKLCVTPINLIEFLTDPPPAALKPSSAFPWHQHSGAAVGVLLRRPPRTTASSGRSPAVAQFCPGMHLFRTRNNICGGSEQHAAGSGSWSRSVNIVKTAAVFGGTSHAVM